MNKTVLKIISIIFTVIIGVSVFSFAVSTALQNGHFYDSKAFYSQSVNEKIS